MVEINYSRINFNTNSTSTIVPIMKNSEKREKLVHHFNLTTVHGNYINKYCSKKFSTQFPQR